MSFHVWLKAFLEEKGYDPGADLFEVEAGGGCHWIPGELVLDAIRRAPPAELAAIKRTLVLIDFRTPGVEPVRAYMRHLARCLAMQAEGGGS